MAHVRVKDDFALLGLLGVVQCRVAWCAGIFAADGKKDWHVDVRCGAAWVVEEDPWDDARRNGVFEVFVLGKEAQVAVPCIRAVQQGRWRETKQGASAACNFCS